MTIAALTLSASSAMAGGLTECVLHQSDCRDLIGKRLWIAVPAANQNTVEISPTRNDHKNTIKLKSGSFVVTNVLKSDLSGHDLVVRTPDGKTGYVWTSHAGIFLSEVDPVATAKAARDECERRGQPKIGMSPTELVASCWGKPKRIVKKTTVAGVEESYVYTIGHIVRLVNGTVAEIIESR